MRVNFPGIEIMWTKPKFRWSGGEKSKKSDFKYASPCKNRELIGNNNGDNYENVTCKNATRAYSISFNLANFSGVEFKLGLYQSSGKEKEGRWLVFMSSTKHEIRHWGFTS